MASQTYREWIEAGGSGTTYGNTPTTKRAASSCDRSVFPGRGCGNRQLESARSSLGRTILNRIFRDVNVEKYCGLFYVQKRFTRESAFATIFCYIPLQKPGMKIAEGWGKPNLPLLGKSPILSWNLWKTLTNLGKTCGDNVEKKPFVVERMWNSWGEVEPFLNFVNFLNLPPFPR